MTDNTYLRPAEAAQLLRLSTSTLAKARRTGTGPIYTKSGRLVLYSLVDLHAWLQSRRRRSTSEGGEV